MRKTEFLTLLRKKLSRLPKNEIQEHTAFYSEMIDDRMEEGLSEAEAVEAIGSVREISAQILGESVISSKREKKDKLSIWEKILLIIGSPIWGTVMLVTFSVSWALVLTLWAVELPFLIFSYLSKYMIIACKFISFWCYWLTKRTVRSMKNLFC